MDNSSFGFDKPEDSPGFLLWQTTVSWQRLIKKALDPHGISHAQFVLLAILLWLQEQKQTPTQVILSRLSKLDKMTVSKSLKLLVLEGLVTRVEHTSDTRAKAVSLSSRGKALAKKLVPIVEQIDAEFFGRIDTAAQRHLSHLLHQLNLQNDA
jgi:DNA-binding MarR family transcriptional regulator